MNKINCISIFMITVISSCYAFAEVEELQKKHALQTSGQQQVSEFTNQLLQSKVNQGQVLSGVKKIEDIKWHQNHDRTQEELEEHRNLETRLTNLQETRELYQAIEDNNIYLLGPHMYMTRDLLVQNLSQRVIMGDITTEEAVAAARNYGDLRRIQSESIRAEIAELDRQIVSATEQIEREEAARARLIRERRENADEARSHLEEDARRSLLEERRRRREEDRRQTAAALQREADLRRIREGMRGWGDGGGNQGGGSGGGRRTGGTGGGDAPDAGLGNLGSDLSNIFGS